MPIDPIVAEVRAAREAIARECNYDIRLISQRARERQQASGRQVVSFAPPSKDRESLASIPSLNGAHDDNVIDGGVALTKRLPADK